MSNGQRITNIIDIISKNHPARNIKFFSGLGKGMNLYVGSKQLPILVSDHTLQDLGSNPELYSVYYDIDGIRYYIDESLLDLPTIPPLTPTIRAFRRIHGIYDENDIE